MSQEEFVWFANGLSDGSISDAQAGAFSMAAYLNGMSPGERVNLTLAMRDSGDKISWDLPGAVIDKHSTGGVGDCVSLILAPALAALGAYVPMISGRGLGHTGGTLDKLEAIPGLKTEVSEAQFRQIVSNTGVAIVSATDKIAPADKRLYNVRDVTGTVGSIDLITASILSKKLAAGAEALVLDVKVGSGAFMKAAEDAEVLARALVDTANGAGCRTSALITDMNQPCIGSVGNALEIMEVMVALTGGAPDALVVNLAAELGGELLTLAGMANTSEIGAQQILDAISDGSAAERFARMIVELGGPADFVERWRDRLPASPVIRQVFPPSAGYVSKIDTQSLGSAVVKLGGGRLRGTDKIDPSVGLSDVALLGDAADPKIPLAIIHAGSDTAAESASVLVLAAYDLSEVKPDPQPLVYRNIR